MAKLAAILAAYILLLLQSSQGIAAGNETAIKNAYQIQPGETPRYSPGIREVQYLPLVWDRA